MARWAGEPSAAAELLRTGLSSGARDRGTSRVPASSSSWARRCGPRATRPAPWLRASALRRRWNRGRGAAGAAGAGAGVARAGPDRDRAVRAVPGHRRARLSSWREPVRRPPATRSRPASRWPRRLPVGATSTAVSRSCTACLTEAVAADAFKAVVRCYGNLAFLLLHSGPAPPRSWRWRRRRERTCRRFGPLLLVAPTLAENWVHALVATGRWDDAQSQARGARTAVGRRGHGADPSPPARPGGGGQGRRTRLRGRDGHHRPVRAARTTRTRVHDVTSARAEQPALAGRRRPGAPPRPRGAGPAGRTAGHTAWSSSLCSLALRAHADLVTSRADREVPAESATRETTSTSSPWRATPASE